MPAPTIDDATWAQLDPLAGTFTPRQWARAAIAVLTTALLLALIWILWWSGVLAPRLALADLSDGTPGRASTATRTFTYSVMLVNHAPRAVEIVSVGRSGPGLRLVSAEGAGSPLPGASSERIDLTYEVTDCSAVTQGEWPIPVTVQGRSGPRVRMLAAPLIDPFWLDGPGVDSADIEGDPSFGDPSLGDPSDGGSDQLGGEPWQTALAGQVCREQVTAD